MEKARLGSDLMYKKDSKALWTYSNFQKAFCKTNRFINIHSTLNFEIDSLLDICLRNRWFSSSGTLRRRPHYLLTYLNSPLDAAEKCFAESMVSLNGKKIKDHRKIPTKQDLLQEKFFVVNIGKGNPYVFYL